MGRPLIFVAHSLGGIVVKEMLSNSDTSPDRDLKNVVESTTAVIFLGTPHRGSQDLAGLGDTIRKAASMISMDTNRSALDALGLKNSDLERCQESFSHIWSSYDFHVKTFQEALGLTGVNIGPLNKKVQDAASWRFPAKYAWHTTESSIVHWKIRSCAPCNIQTWRLASRLSKVQ
ncbi:hypothetical protein NKR23_g717 [Pleurostoma richardsiae]|uniref:DUF676 domain-containing protein n=1 Tax=Pleurostoma richardsiae TaxID=41990 RepID=A0AA38RSM5_9PEZI|nr:hypothetical protein NKR23_g717 [Pleurostoma richardsiae]